MPKERIFSFRNENHAWDPKNQRPEMWKLYNSRDQQRREHPCLPNLQLDRKRYLAVHTREKTFRIVPLYFATRTSGGMTVTDNIIMVDDDRLKLRPGEKPEMTKMSVSVHWAVIR